MATAVLEEEDVELTIAESLCMQRLDRIQVVSFVVVADIEDIYVHHALVLHKFDTSLDTDVAVCNHHEKILDNHHEEQSSFDFAEDELVLC